MNDLDSAIQAGDLTAFNSAVDRLLALARSSDSLQANQ
jgi:hypothetical protein